jgi:dTDP-4-dehydro-6-deoxy-alpha-D-gulose 4-ketoreductase
MKNSYWKNKTVMISGGSGFIGSHFVEELAAAGANVICLFRTTIGGNLLDQKD